MVFSLAQTYVGKAELPSTAHWLAAAFALMLSGCQILPTMSEPELFVWNSAAETVESHEFSIADNQSIVGGLASVDSQEDDTLSDFARHFGLGFNDIAYANPHLDPWILHQNQQILLPLQFILPDAPRKGIVLNLANMRMFYYPSRDAKVLTYPIGIGRDGWGTPLGVTKIVAKRANPAWTVPSSILREHRLQGDPLPKVVPSGPDNPLGYYAMPLGFNGYLIHGTNKPYGIGMQVSHGCVQLYPEDVEVLFKKVAVGTPVRIVHQPYLAAWSKNGLYLEVHRPLDKWARQDKKLQQAVRAKLQKLAADNNVAVDWVRVEEVLARADGIPAPVSLNSPDLAAFSASAVKVRRPDKLFGQPVVNELTEADWSIVTEDFANENDARKLAAMLNHQGPQIPARRVEKDGMFQVVAGPFKDKKEAKVMAKRIQSNFDLDAKPVKPQVRNN
jgi:L,D-transpeptidase ErfK/SrfK